MELEFHTCNHKVSPVWSWTPVLVRTSTNMLSTSRLICLCRANQTARNFPPSKFPSRPCLQLGSLSLNPLDSQLQFDLTSLALVLSTLRRSRISCHLENLCTGTGFTIGASRKITHQAFLQLVFPSRASATSVGYCTFSKRGRCAHYHTRWIVAGPLAAATPRCETRPW